MLGRFLVGALALAGCAVGGRITGGVMADRDGAVPFVGVTAEVAFPTTRNDLAFEGGGRVTSDDHHYATAGLRFEQELRDIYGVTAAVTGGGGNGDGFAQLSVGGLLSQRWLEDERPDALASWLLAMTAEAVVGAGGPRTSDLEVRGGFQLGLGFLYVLTMR